jgi:hypothetical protein
MQYFGLQEVNINFSRSLYDRRNGNILQVAVATIPVVCLLLYCGPSKYWFQKAGLGRFFPFRLRRKPASSGHPPKLMLCRVKPDSGHFLHVNEGRIAVMSGHS